jgi:hypothetical protein
VNTDPEIQAAIDWLRGGKRARYRKPDRERRKTWTEIEAADALDGEYAQLLYMQRQFRTVEELELEVFEWATNGVGYDDAAEWLHQGAGYGQKNLLFRLARVGITPEDTACWWDRDQDGRGVTIMQALLRDQATIAAVLEAKREGGLTACGG